ncbi:MAG: VCBS repeat-containing protein, partial [Myxococcales bacterium]|nr:VCBS repeat-containing protein [Myxococcales bacterium]
DGDGDDELYVGLAAYRRGLHVLRDDGDRPRLEVAEATTDQSGSDINDLLVADLDGDGTRELVAALGPWKAYDLRVFRAAEDDALELVDRVGLGNVSSVAVLRGRDGAPLLAALKDDRWPDRRVFPAAPHTGEPAGVYFFSFDGDRLERRGFVDPLASFTAPARAFPGRLFAADLDGDGVDDLAFNANTDETALGRMLVLLRQGSDGFTAAPIAGLSLLGVAELDDDPLPELLVRDFTELNAMWALGLGDDPLPPAYAPTAGIEAPPEVRTTEARENWRRADRLAAFGLASTAAASLDAATRLSDARSERRALAAYAAELYAAAGDDRRALDLFPQPLDDDPHRRAAVAGALIRLGRYREAKEIVAGVDAPPHLPDQLRVEDLERVADDHRRVTFDFSRSLDPRWEFPDPLGLRRDPTADTLVLRARQRAAPLARLPLDWDGGPLVLDAALAVVHSEFAGTLDVAIRAADGSRIAGFWISVRGGGELYEHQIGCLLNDSVGHGILAARPLTTVEERVDYDVRVTLLPERGAATCRLRGGDAKVIEHNLRDPLPAGPYTLEIASGARTDDAPTYLEVELARL